MPTTITKKNDSLYAIPISTASQPNRIYNVARRYKSTTFHVQKSHEFKWAYRMTNHKGRQQPIKITKKNQIIPAQQQQQNVAKSQQMRCTRF